jgi:hypothetical protein
MYPAQLETVTDCVDRSASGSRSLASGVAGSSPPQATSDVARARAPIPHSVRRAVLPVFLAGVSVGLLGYRIA